MVLTNKEINLTQLSEELGNKALVMSYTDASEKLIQAADGVELDESHLEAAIKSHTARDDNAIRLASRQAVLDRLGITDAEAKLLLS